MQRHDSSSDEETLAAVAASLSINNDAHIDDLTLTTALSLLEDSSDDEWYQIARLAAAERRCNTRHSCQYEWALFVNAESLCWLHSLTQAISRCMRMTPAQALALKDEIYNELGPTYQTGRGQNAVRALQDFCDNTQNAGLKQAFRNAAPLEWACVCGEQTFERTYDDNLVMGMLRNGDTMNVLFKAEYIEAAGQIARCEDHAAVITEKRFPGKVAVVVNQDYHWTAEHRIITNPDNTRVRYELVAVIRHYRHEYRRNSRGHAFTDVLCDDGNFRRIDDAEPDETPVVELAGTTGACDGHVYFYVKI